jgi:hypothetical protein
VSWLGPGLLRAPRALRAPLDATLAVCSRQRFPQIFSDNRVSPLLLTVLRVCAWRPCSALLSLCAACLKFARMADRFPVLLHSGLGFPPSSWPPWPQPGVVRAVACSGFLGLPLFRLVPPHVTTCFHVHGLSFEYVYETPVFDLFHACFRANSWTFRPDLSLRSILLCPGSPATMGRSQRLVGSGSFSLDAK